MIKKADLPLLLLSFILAAFTLVSCVNNPVDCSHCEKEDTNPKTAYEYFVELSAIPRCTNNEKAAIDHLEKFAKARGFETYRDNMSNLLIRKNGSKGRENEPPVILQAHIDMVCVKDNDFLHDFKNDPIIPVIVDDHWVRASGRTTLGADNGSGVSMIMAVLASTSISHPPIEALLTVQEETGLIGALAFNVSELRGERLINLDCVQEKKIIAGSKRGGSDADTFIPMLPEALAKIASLPDWHYKEESPLRDKMIAVFKKVYDGEEPLIVQINSNKAGVEPMAFAGRMPHLDMVSIGPDIFDIHTPNERMNLSSFYRVYNYLVTVLEAL